MQHTVPVRRPAIVALALAVLGTLSGLCRADDFDRWYQVLMAGAPAGWSRATQTTSGDEITTSGEFVFHIKRGPIDLAITMTSEFVETADGRPISMSTVQKMGDHPVETAVTYDGNSMTIVTTQNGRTTTSVKPTPKAGWLTPAAASRYSKERLAAGETSIVFTTIEPLSSTEPITMTRRITGPATLTLDGRTFETIKSIVETSIAPGIKTVEFADQSGLPLKSQTQMGGIDLTLVVAGPEVAQAAPGEAPELMVKTFVHPDREIKSPRKAARATYILSVAEDELPALPSAGAQRVEMLDARRARVSIDLAGVGPAPAAEAEDPQFADACTALDTDDGAIRALAQRATQNAGDDKAKRAEAIRRFVYRFIKKKDLDVAFATASEVAQNRKGDCSEHGVLTAALLRADGIPSRVVVGLIYADQFAGAQGIFGYHMWTQALLDVDGVKKWVDLDATLPRSTPFDATHITLGLTSLADGQPQNSMVSLASLLGRVKIEVESVEHPAEQ